MMRFAQEVPASSDATPGEDREGCARGRRQEYMASECSMCTKLQEESMGNPC